MLSASIKKRFQTAAPSSAHGADRPLREIKVFRIKLGPEKSVRLERMSLRELAIKAAQTCARTGEERAEASPALQAQIRESFEAYLDGDVRPIDEFLAELEAELNEQ